MDDQIYQYKPEPLTLGSLEQHISTRSRPTKHRLRLWLLIVYYIRASNKKSADITDPEFIRFINDFRKLSRKEISRQLALMHKAGILGRTYLRRSLSREDCEAIFAQEDGEYYIKGDWLDDPMATAFYRYHLPGDECPRHLNV